LVLGKRKNIEDDEDDRDLDDPEEEYEDLRT